MAVVVRSHRKNNNIFSYQAQVGGKIAVGEKMFQCPRDIERYINDIHKKGLNFSFFFL